uniref:Uncharacterized protein n=1 Tax=Panagrolaimus sp. ES5 TaxID=591445 RepID=A0AC34GIS6_9BILA
MNARIEILEQDLNAIIPVTPKWSATFQKDSNKNIVIRKGFIYKKFTDDEPPAAILITLPRIISPAVITWPMIEHKFSKMVKFLEEKSFEIFKWRSQISLCLKNVKLIQRYMAELEENKDEF